MPSGFHLDPPPEFQGIDPDKPLTFTRRHLPHWRQPGATYFITFRLADSIPQHKIEELKFTVQQKSRALDAQLTTGELSEAKKQQTLDRLTFQLSEHYLDLGMGSCIFNNEKYRTIVSDLLHQHIEKHYILGSYVIMPNHVHLIIQPLPDIKLPKILQTLKRISSFKINQAIHSKGALWQSESYDRIIRNTEHLWRCLQYIGNNPHKAKLSKKSFTRWVNPNWQSLGWNFSNEP